ncbi:MAG: hypothetical protein ACI9NC_006435, partial [Verrucomicrobiales bacterium]
PVENRSPIACREAAPAPLSVSKATADDAAIDLAMLDLGDFILAKRIRGIGRWLKLLSKS